MLVRNSSDSSSDRRQLFQASSGWLSGPAVGGRRDAHCQEFAIVAGMQRVILLVVRLNVTQLPFDFIVFSHLAGELVEKASGPADAGKANEFQLDPGEHTANRLRP